MLIIMISEYIYINPSFHPFTPVGEGPTEIPLAIMTSDDTHIRTTELLEKNAYFGMKPSQIKLLKQVISRRCLSLSTPEHQQIDFNIPLAYLGKSCLFR